MKKLLFFLKDKQTQKIDFLNGLIYDKIIIFYKRGNNSKNRFFKWLNI